MVELKHSTSLIRALKRSDNPALSFYSRLGFEEIERVGLRSGLAEKGAIVVWKEDAAAAHAPVELVKLRYCRE